MLTADDFLAAIDAFLARSGMSASAFGRAAIGDPSLVIDLRQGRKPNLGTVQAVAEFMKQHDEAREQERAAS